MLYTTVFTIYIKLLILKKNYKIFNVTILENKIKQLCVFISLTQILIFKVKLKRIGKYDYSTYNIYLKKKVTYIYFNII